MPIYIVDDNSDLSEFLSCLLTDIGYTTHSFSHPSDAIAHMQKTRQKPSILITDYNLPAMNGFELHLKALSLFENIKTIVISGRNVSEKIGKLHFLQKPFSPDEIAQLIQSIKTNDE
ncbi:C4-dicarboxylate transport transcriptional regulatory protein DctD [Mariprofundus micogutta]|uniref:C4-dicarboxylate transport transcriptional regulatory protein DctD n=1 Tax=Mariprofundus micogutta TaxID=1921010 RepID=A0A1L8CRF2_9PROT|nr:response regulator [Mariprofundus micogutta]GAV21454.1 C4-dicarboxylate transport transcriptional regulatory protein DctD [Mariprofundus micogutta]